MNFIQSTAYLLLVVLISQVLACSPGCLCVGTLMQCSGLTQIPTSVDRVITEADLSKNFFRSSVLERVNLTGLTGLTSLKLKNTGISAIGHHAFVDMTNLKSLDLSMNNLAVLNRETFYSLNLDFLYLESNPSLSLRKNTFESMTTKHISLNECGLTSIDPDVFIPLASSLRKLELRGNKIERINPRMMTVFANLDMLRINGNPLICDCESKWLKEFYDLNKDKVHDDTTSSFVPRCLGPAHMAGQFFNRVTVFDFACDQPTLSANISFTNHKGILTCISRGNPLPTITWYRPNGMISQTNPQGNMAASLNVIELSASDNDVKGQYRCVATNDAGNISFTVNVDWPFPESKNVEPCGTVIVSKEGRSQVESTTDLSMESPHETSVFKIKYFTFVDLIGGILGTFACTLIITVLVLHFCVYRRRMDSPYMTPPSSEYSSASDKNSTIHHQLSQTQLPLQRPLPHKPHYKMFDEHHYMSTNLDERDEFLRISAGSQGRMTPSCETCPACTTGRTLSSYAPTSA